MNQQRVAFVDLDGVVTNSDARFALATTNGKIDWRIALSGEHVSLDTLLEGGAAELDRLEAEGFTIVFLTSRLEDMREATVAWLNQHELLKACRRLEMKPLSERYTKTAAWKAARLHELALELSATDVRFIDDEAANCRAVMQRMPQVSYALEVWTGFTTRFVESHALSHLAPASYSYECLECGRRFNGKRECPGCGETIMIR